MHSPNRKQYFKSWDELYRNKALYFISVANKALYNSDFAIDVVHSAFAYCIKNLLKHPRQKIREQVVLWRVKRECRMANKNGLAPLCPLNETLDNVSDHKYNIG